MDNVFMIKVMSVLYALTTILGFICIVSIFY